MMAVPAVVVMIGCFLIKLVRKKKQGWLKSAADSLQFFPYFSNYKQGRLKRCCFGLQSNDIDARVGEEKDRQPKYMRFLAEDGREEGREGGGEVERSMLASSRQSVFFSGSLSCFILD